MRLPNSEVQECSINNLEFNVDISYGGAFYAIVDVDDLNLTVDNKNIPELQNWGDAIKHELERSFTIEHLTLFPSQLAYAVTGPHGQSIINF